MTRFRVLAFVSALLAGLAVSGAVAQAPAWPTRSVRFIVPLGPGAAVDVGARLFAEKLSQRWGQPVVVENRPGGDSIIDRKSTRLNSSHLGISYAVFCLKKKK